MSLAEEPPPNTLLLLLTVNSRKLLPTIRSRCQTISLLRNRQNYELAAQKGLFTVLSKLKRGAGAGIGLKTSARITAMFAELHKDAEALAEETKDHRWDDTEDARIKKQLEEEYVAKIEAEYVRLRESMLSALTAPLWFPMTVGLGHAQFKSVQIAPAVNMRFAVPARKSVFVPIICAMTGSR